jgi:2,3-bisphosphoglycerate-independent phosphoglycerate mutase
MDMRDGDLAWRANFATVDENDTIIDRRAGRDLSTDEATQLADACNANITLESATSTLLATSEHRGVFHLRYNDGPLSAEISNSDPAYARQGSLGVALEKFEPYVKECEALDGSESARIGAALTNDWTWKAHAILDAHDVNRARDKRGRPVANIVLVRDAGNHIPVVQSLKDRFGMDFACFAEMPVEIGISKVTGMEPILVTSPTDPAGYSKLAERTIEALDGFDALYVHLKGPDVPAHDGRAFDKRDVIADIDEGYFGTLLPELGGGVVIAVTADHSTSCVRKAHTADPVPIVIAERGLASDGTRAFSESDAAAGSLGRLHGTQVLPMLVDLARS